MKKLLALLLMILCLAFAVTGCGGDDNAPETDGKHPLVAMEFEDHGTVYIELYPEYAPNTVNNFIALIEDGYYDGLTIHRVINDLIIQGGDPDGNGTGGPGYSILGEVSGNGFTQNTLSHTAGVISMARKSSGYDTAGSQFFIMAADYPGWDGEYCAFGKVIQGLEIVTELSGAECNPITGLVSEEIVIKEVTVNTFDVDYPDPEIIKN